MKPKAGSSPSKLWLEYFIGPLNPPLPHSNRLSPHPCAFLLILSLVFCHKPPSQWACLCLPRLTMLLYEPYLRSNVLCNFLNFHNFFISLELYLIFSYQIPPTLKITRHVNFARFPHDSADNTRSLVLWTLTITVSIPSLHMIHSIHPRKVGSAMPSLNLTWC